MSRFNKYARKVDEIAKAAFDDYHKAANAYRRAEDQAKQYPQRNGLVDAQYAVKSARARADLIEAKETFKAAQKAFEDHTTEIAAIRNELIEELDDYYGADPAALDIKTLELLKAGILKPSEYSKLMNEAQEKENYTMARMIAKYAGDAAEKIGKKYGTNNEQAYELRSISYEANQNNGNNTLQRFDAMVECYSRTTKNPAMIDAWGDLTGDIVENL